MCKKRKYQYYDIKVTNIEDNSVEKIDILNNANVDKTDYNLMLDKYSDIKKRYKNKNVVIDFYGISENTTMKIIYEKKFIQDNNTENIYDICDNLSNNILNFVSKFNKLGQINYNLVDAYNKKENLVLHKFDNLPRKNKYELTDKEIDKYLNIAVNIQAIRASRRDIKNQIKLMKLLNGIRIIPKLKTINNLVTAKKYSVMHFSEKAAKKWNNNEVDLQRKYIEQPYKTDKERIRLTSNFQHKYQKVTYDENRKVVIGYNKCVQY